MEYKYVYYKNIEMLMHQLEILMYFLMLLVKNDLNYYISDVIDLNDYMPNV